MPIRESIRPRNRLFGTLVAEGVTLLIVGSDALAAQKERENLQQ